MTFRRVLIFYLASFYLAMSVRGQFWQPDPTFAPVLEPAGGVTAFVRQADGKLLVAGSFTRVNGASLPSGCGLVRLNSNGSTDSTFSATLAANERIFALRLQPNGKILATGSFPVVSSSDTVVRFNADGSRDPSFRLSPAAIDANGYFYSVKPDGVGLIRYTPAGEVDPSFENTSVSYSAYVIPLADGTVVASSGIVTLTTPLSLVRLRHDGSIDPSFVVPTTALPPTVLGLTALPDSRLLVFGRRNASDGVALQCSRLGRDGAADYTYIGPDTGVGILLSYHAVDIAGVLLDVLREANAPPGSHVQTSYADGGATAWLDVTNDGKLALRTEGSVFSQLQRTSSTGPSFDAKPSILIASPFRSLELSLGMSRTIALDAIGGLFPLVYQWMKNGVAIPGANSPAYVIDAAHASDAGSYTLSAANAYGTVTTAAIQVSINTVYVPLAITRQPASQTATIGSSASLGIDAAGNPVPAFQWLQNGSPMTLGPDAFRQLYDTSSVMVFPHLQPIQAGIYNVAITPSGSISGTAIISAPAILGPVTGNKVVGTGTELQPANIPHPNGNTFDQVLLTGAAKSITADANQVTRTSFIDLNNDIVQVEFTGAGTLSLVLDNPTGPAVPLNYNQPSVTYMKGHAGIVIAGANETTNLSIFSVGRVTAFDPTGGFNFLLPISPTNNPANNGSSLFTGHATTAYDGVADVAFIAILSTDGKFGGLRASNAGCFGTKGYTGIYAPGVQFTGPVFIGDINAFDAATPVFIIGSSSDTRITGGDLQQSNSQPVQVKGLTALKFTAGANSHNAPQPAQINKAILRDFDSAADVTSQIVVNPGP